MMLNTAAGSQIDAKFLHSYFRSLVNSFFKVLPMRENNEDSLPAYMRSLQLELLGCKEFIIAIQDNSMYLTLLAILQYLIDNPECKVSEVKKEVFRAISICNKLQSQYVGEVCK